MRVYLGSDHAGFDLKSHLLGALAAQGFDVVDVGAHVLVPDDDYPAYCLATGAAVVGDEGSLGVVIGGSGNGEQIAANKIPGVRAALAWNNDTATLAREHNDANVVGIGARQHTVDEATELVLAFLRTPFSHDERHQRRIDELHTYESSHQLPALPS